MGKPRFNAQSLGHKEDHYLLPEEIIIDETWNGRFMPHSEEDVKERAIDMILNGQLAPVLIRKNLAMDGRPQLVAGFLRTKAAKWINDKVVPAGGIQVGETFVPFTQPFKIWAAVKEGNDADSLKANIIENLSRKQTTVMDSVINQSRLLKANMTEEEVAALYKLDSKTGPAQIRRNQLLLKLSKDVQKLIHFGVISAEAGFNLLELTEEDQKQTLTKLLEAAQTAGHTVEHSEEEFLKHVPGPEADNANFRKRVDQAIAPADADGQQDFLMPPTANGDASANGGKRRPRTQIPTADVRGAVRQRQQQQGKKGPPLSFSEFKQEVRAWNVPGEDPAIREFAKKMELFWQGDISADQMYNALKKIRLDASELSKTNVAQEPEEKGKKGKGKKGKATAKA